MEEEKEVQTFPEFIASLTLSPKNIYRMTWTTIRGILYLLCFFIDPLVYALKFEPVVRNASFNRF